MHQAAKLMKRWPRLSTTFSFCAAGTALSILWWSPIILQKQSALLFVLFIGIPGISAAIAGWILGEPLLDPARVCRPISAAIRGATIASFALLLYAPLFAIIYVCTQPATEHWSIPGLTILILMGSALTAWIRIALTGAAVGWALYYIASHDTG